MDYSIEKLKAQQEARILSSKIYGDGTTPVPHGIVDMLFIDEASGKISKYTGQEATKGRVLFLLPFRTPKNLQKFASYTQPAEWKMKFNRGMMVNAVIENGYIKKLIPSYQFMAPARILDPETMEVEFVYPSEENSFDEPKPAQKKRDDIQKFEEEGVRLRAEREAKLAQSVPVGFEVEETPF